jgi:hypothetical protein
MKDSNIGQTHQIQGEGFVTWMVDDKSSIHMGVAAVGADQGTDGSDVGPTLIPEEPMSIVLNLGMLHEFSSLNSFGWH